MSRFALTKLFVLSVLFTFGCKSIPESQIASDPVQPGSGDGQIYLAMIDQLRDDIQLAMNHFQAALDNLPEVNEDMIASPSDRPIDGTGTVWPDQQLRVDEPLPPLPELPMDNKSSAQRLDTIIIQLRALLPAINNLYNKTTGSPADNDMANLTGTVVRASAMLDLNGPNQEYAVENIAMMTNEDERQTGFALGGDSKDDNKQENAASIVVPDVKALLAQLAQLDKEAESLANQARAAEIAAERQKKLAAAERARQRALSYQQNAAQARGRYNAAIYDESIWTKRCNQYVDMWNAEHPSRRSTLEATAKWSTSGGYFRVRKLIDHTRAESNAAERRANSAKSDIDSNERLARDAWAEYNRLLQEAR